MKITKLMLSALVAAAALVSCNKEDLTPVTTGLKTVNISLENAIMTKGPAGNKINAGDAVQVNDLKIFLTDNNMSVAYPAHDINGREISTYYSSFTSAIEDQYHFVSDKCSKVLVVANCGNVTFDQVKNMQSIAIVTQQDQTDLILIGYDVLVRATDDPNTTDVDESIHTGVTESGDFKYTEVYNAAVTLSPIISRFEIDGFAIKFENNTFSEITITDVAFQHYFKSSYYVSGGFAPANDVYAPLNDMEDKVAVFNWFNDDANKNMWYRDAVSGVTLTPADNVEEVASKFAYHFYPGNIIPTMMIKLIAGGQPAYVYTTNYKLPDGGSLQNLEAGMIYRMNSTSGNGIVEIPDNFDPIQRCINIDVTVSEWAVTLITPDFGSGSTQNN